MHTYVYTQGTSLIIRTTGNYMKEHFMKDSEDHSRRFDIAYCLQYHPIMLVVDGLQQQRFVIGTCRLSPVAAAIDDRGACY